MTTRPRSSTGRSSKKKKTPPFAGSAIEDEQQTGSKHPTDSKQASAGATTEAAPEVTRTTLQKRELPSLSDDRQARIAERAYWRAERRGFAPGGELEDWLEAEREVDSRPRG